MLKLNEKLIFHIDVNSAFLSWSATDKLIQGEDIDLRDIASVIGGDEEVSKRSSTRKIYES